MEDRSIKSLRKLLEYEPENTQLHADLARALEREGQYEESLEHYQLAVQHGSKDGSVYNSMSFLMIKSGDIFDAAPLIDKAVMFGAKRLPLMNMASVHFVEGNFSHARRYYQESLKLWDSEDAFFAALKDDFTHLIQYGLTEADFTDMISSIKSKE